MFEKYPKMRVTLQKFFYTITITVKRGIYTNSETSRACSSATVAKDEKLVYPRCLYVSPVVQCKMSSSKRINLKRDFVADV